MGKELTVTEKQSAIVLPAVNIEGLITQGLERAASIDVMERLFLMRRELKSEAAREAFFTALSKLQAEMPVIEKTKKVFEKGSTTRVRYCYAPLDSIVEQTKTVLQKNGFSYTIKVLQTEKTVEVICEAHHAAGHTEATGFSVPLGSAQYMSMAQETGSANTFAKRYAFCNAFGIMTGDEDTDGSDEYRKKELLIHLHKYIYEPEKTASDAAKQEYFSKAKVKLGAWAKMAGFTFTTFKSLEGKNLQDILIIARAESAGI